MSYLEIGLKSSVFQLSYQPHSSLADCARVLYKPSKDLTSLWVCNEKTFRVLGFFCEYPTSYQAEIQPLPKEISNQFQIWHKNDPQFVFIVSKFFSSTKLISLCFYLSANEFPRRIDPKVLQFCRRTHFKIRFELPIRSHQHLGSYSVTPSFFKRPSTLLQYTFSLDAIWHEFVTFLVKVCTFHDGCKQGIDQQIFNRKSISRKITNFFSH